VAVDWAIPKKVYTVAVKSGAEDNGKIQSLLYHCCSFLESFTKCAKLKSSVIAYAEIMLHDYEWLIMCLSHLYKIIN
jgi:hypothetical protein